MGRIRWHIERTASGVTLARHWPPRFDVCGDTVLSVDPAALSLTRVAHQIRQDLWRRLQKMRGFSPVVALRYCENGLDIRAGGRAAPPIAATASAEIAAVLNDRIAQARWIHWAKQGRRP